MIFCGMRSKSSKYSDRSSAEGFVNTAFEEDEDSLDNTVTYARWINRISDRQDDSEIELSVKQRNKDIVAELNEAFKACSTKEVLDSDDHDDEEGDNDGDSDTELDIYERPSAGISRRVMLRALSGQQQELGEVQFKIYIPIKYIWTHFPFKVRRAPTPSVHTTSGSTKGESSQSLNC